MSATEWRRTLSEHNPGILVAGWNTPALPDDVVKEVAPALSYVCYLPGSVRKLVTRQMIEAGLLVSNWASSISRTVAECALLLALSCMRKASYWNEQMHNQGGWKDGSTLTQSLFRKTCWDPWLWSSCPVVDPFIETFYQQDLRLLRRRA